VFRSGGGRCPTCLLSLSRDEIQRRGILHSRVPSRGGPFYTLSCPNCGGSLVAEFDAAGGYRLLDEAGLRGRPALLRVLRFFLAEPQAKGRPKASRREAPRAAGNGRTAAVRGKVRGPQARRLLADLGIPDDATFRDVQRRFREYVKREHPDRRHAAGDREASDRDFAATLLVYRRLLELLRRDG
jgi:hypothetical protein